MAATLHVAATAPINPPGATPVLSAAQVWEGLRRKIRRAEEFVPLIESCAVVADEGGVVTRRVRFAGAGADVTEVCTEFAPSRVHFRMDGGTEVQNIISRGVDARDDDDGGLFMTYAFSWRLAAGGDGGEGAEAVERARAKQQAVSGRHVARLVACPHPRPPSSPLAPASSPGAVRCKAVVPSRPDRRLLVPMLRSKRM